jgi:epoxyqueuosine reductase QueG
MATEAEKLAAALKALAGASTADLVAVAPGEAFSEEELGDLGRAFGPVRAVVVLAQRLVDPVQLLHYRSHDSYQESAVVASFADAMLRDACWRAVERLEQAGYRATIARNLRYADGAPRHHLSFKKAAALAGLGAFGRNQLLIHPEWGPWLRLRVVVTDAPLPADQPLSFSPCTGCEACLQVCPVGALSEHGFARPVCEDYYNLDPDQEGGSARVSERGRHNCDECMRACPVGKAPGGW